jgi:uncharacterized membrane protein
VGGALGSTLMILVSGAIVGVTRRRFWDMSLRSLPWGVDIVFSKALAWLRTFVGKILCGFCTQRKNHTLWMQDRNLKDVNVFGNTNSTSFECKVKLW